MVQFSIHQAQRFVKDDYYGNEQVPVFPLDACCLYLIKLSYWVSREGAISVTHFHNMDLGFDVIIGDGSLKF